MNLYLQIKAETLLSGKPPDWLPFHAVQDFWAEGFAGNDVLVYAVDMLLYEAAKSGALILKNEHVARQDFIQWWPKVPTVLHPTSGSFIWVWLRPAAGEPDAENPMMAARPLLAARIKLEDDASSEPLSWPALFVIPAVKALCVAAGVNSAESMRKLDEVNALGLRPRKKGRGKGNAKSVD